MAVCCPNPEPEPEPEPSRPLSPSGLLSFLLWLQHSSIVLGPTSLGTTES